MFCSVRYHKFSVSICVLFVTMSVLFVNKNNVMKYRVVGEGRQTAEHAVERQRGHSRFSPQQSSYFAQQTELQRTHVNGGSCHKYNFCRDKHLFVPKKHVLSRETDFCPDKGFVTTTIILSPRP